ncbi:MAG TPA: hypothetical protein VI391_06320 [Thermoanaerobaculia bacterium]
MPRDDFVVTQITQQFRLEYNRAIDTTDIATAPARSRKTVVLCGLAAFVCVALAYVATHFAGVFYEEGLSRGEKMPGGTVVCMLAAFALFLGFLVFAFVAWAAERAFAKGR